MGALSGLKVLELSRFIAGPFCAMQLADMGADVVKVERPGRGEDARALLQLENGESLFFASFNRNKRSLTVDLRDAGGQALLRRLAAEADVLVENFRAGTLEKLGCGWEALHAANPRLVLVRVSGFGQDGPYADRPCFDAIAQAMSGLMQLTGEPDGPPTLAGSFVVDYVTGLYATIGALGALQKRQETGRGQVVDVALLDSAVSLLMTAIPEWLLEGRALGRIGSVDRYTAPGRAFRAADGRWVEVLGGVDAIFPRLARAIGRPALAADPRFATNAARMRNRDAIEAIVGEWVAARPADAAVAALTEAEVPCAKVATIPEVVANPQLRHRGQIAELDHPTIGRLPMHGLTVKLSETPGALARAAPTVGQHTEEVLREWLGMAAAEIEGLRAAGAV